MKHVTHVLGWFSDLVDFFKGNGSITGSSSSSSASSSAASSAVSSSSSTNSILNSIQEIFEKLGKMINYLGEGIDEVLDHLVELDRAIMETHEVALSTRTAVFWLIGIVIVAFIIVMIRMSSLKRDNDDLRDDIRALNDKIANLTSYLQGYASANRSKPSEPTPSAEEPGAEEKVEPASSEDVVEVSKAKTDAERQNEADNDPDDKSVIGAIIMAIGTVIIIIFVAIIMTMGQ